jgi:hypothetical protein
MKPILPELFYHDGRGPELVSVHWSGRGQVLEAIDFMPPDAETRDDIYHLTFTGLQVVEIIPEEVADFEDGGLCDALIAHRPAALFDAGKSKWLSSFSQRHLGKCSHFRIMFYDELFEVIAVEVRIEKGKYK